MLGTRDYVTKNGFTDVVIGLSGGIDSSLVAAIAADALGAEHVHGVSMPSRYSSDHSTTDAEALAEQPRHRLPHHRHRAALTRRSLEMLAPSFDGRAPDLTEENLQSRIRGITPHGAVEQVRAGSCSPPATRARWPWATPPSTATPPAASPCIKDVPKLLVYDARAGSATTGPAASSSPRPCSPSRRRPSCAPTSATTRACRPTRCSTRSSRPTSSSDRTARRARSRPASTPRSCARIARLVDLPSTSAARPRPGVRVTAKAFGKDRRLPITNGYRATLTGRSTVHVHDRAGLRRGAVRSSGVMTTSAFGRSPGWAAGGGHGEAEVLELLIGPYDEDTDHPWHRVERGEIPITEWVQDGAASWPSSATSTSTGRSLRASERADRPGGHGGRGPHAPGRGYAGPCHQQRPRGSAAWRSLLPVDELFCRRHRLSEVGMRKPDPASTTWRSSSSAASAERAVFLDDAPRQRRRRPARRAWRHPRHDPVERSWSWTRCWPTTVAGRQPSRRSRRRRAPGGPPRRWWSPPSCSARRSSSCRTRRAGVGDVVPRRALPHRRRAAVAAGPSPPGDPARAPPRAVAGGRLLDGFVLQTVGLQYTDSSTRRSSPICSWCSCRSCHR